MKSTTKPQVQDNINITFTILLFYFNLIFIFIKNSNVHAVY